MFIEKDPEDIYFKPDFTIINACNVINSKWETDGLNSENFVVLNLDKKVGIIGGTHYGGEMKKGIFSKGGKLDVMQRQMNWSEESEPEIVQAINHEHFRKYLF